jgi:hypothetical protein
LFNLQFFDAEQVGLGHDADKGLGAASASATSATVSSRLLQHATPFSPEQGEPESPLTDFDKCKDLGFD